MSSWCSYKQKKTRLDRSRGGCAAVLKRSLQEEIVKAISHQIVQAIQPPRRQQTAQSTSQKRHTLASF